MNTHTYVIYVTIACFAATPRQHNYQITLTARQTDVHRWRVTFDIPAHWLIKSWGVDTELNYIEGHQARLEPKEEGLIPAGKSQDFYFGLWAPRTDLQHLHAVRLS